ncbi:MAG: helix-turn-helix domain-containing protein [bacterium]|nr:helix-turn-helix domain-containing protein [Candidatus Colisoma equi]
MAKHMTLDTRKGIAHGLSCGLTFVEMSGMFHRAESTIANEVKNRMIWSNKGYGCNRQTRCPLRKRDYVADAAQENYKGILRDARRGTQAAESVIADMNAALKAPIRTGSQSIRAVMAAKPIAFHGFSERSVHNYVNSQLFDVKCGDMPLMCRRKPPRPGKTVAETDARTAQTTTRIFNLRARLVARTRNSKRKPSDRIVTGFVAATLNCRLVRATRPSPTA